MNAKTEKCKYSKYAMSSSQWLNYVHICHIINILIPSLQQLLLILLLFCFTSNNPYSHIFLGLLLFILPGGLFVNVSFRSLSFLILTWLQLRDVFIEIRIWWLCSQIMFLSILEYLLSSKNIYFAKNFIFPFFGQISETYVILICHHCCNYILRLLLCFRRSCLF